MAEFVEKYINPFTDFGFKKLFGEELNKDLLLDFLNELLKEEQGQIKDLTYLKTEHLGLTESDRKAIFDLYCENERGEKFIVELQKSKQNFFKDRTVYYSTFPIREQAEKGEWNYNLKAVYCIGILDFTFDDYKTEPEKSEVVHTIKRALRPSRMARGRRSARLSSSRPPSATSAMSPLGSRSTTSCTTSRPTEHGPARPSSSRPPLFSLASR